MGCVRWKPSGHTPRQSLWAPFDTSGHFLGHVRVKFPRLTMKWLASVRAMLPGGSRSAPVTPAASPNMPSKADLHAKQLRGADRSLSLLSAPISPASSAAVSEPPV
eukprot:superscaffoldBa00000521_g5382